MTETLLRLFRAILASYPGSSSAQGEGDCIDSRGTLAFRLGIPGPHCSCGGSWVNHIVVVSPREGGGFFVRVGSQFSGALVQEGEVVAQVHHLVENYGI